MSMPPQNNGPNGPRLTDSQKKANHILSEQKRREAIRQGFDRLAELVPGMQDQGRSEAAMLNATVAWLRTQLQKKERMREYARNKGKMSDEKFEQTYKDAARAVDAAEEAEREAEEGQAGSSRRSSGSGR